MFVGLQVVHAREFECGSLSADVAYCPFLPKKKIKRLHFRLVGSGLSIDCSSTATSLG